jgi:glycosyltransferase involved in cell wall biosynthesis
MNTADPYVIILSPDPAHPGGVTRAIDTWLQGGLSSHLAVRRISVTDMDARLPIQLAQTARAYLNFIALLLSNHAKPTTVQINVSTGAGLYREWLAARIAIAFHAAVVTHLHSGAYERWAGRKRMRRLFTRDLFRRSRVVIVPAKVWVGPAIRLGADIVRVVPHGLDNTFAAQLADIADGNGPPSEDEIIVLNYGRWAIVKGLDLLGQAIRDLSSSHRSRLSLRLFGNGDRSWLEDCFADIECASIHIGGWLTDDDKLRELSKAHVFVQPSRDELFAQTLLEAMAAGKRIITSDVGGIPEVVEGYSRVLLVKPGDTRALRDALERIMDGRWSNESPPRLPAISTRFLAHNIATELGAIYRAAALNQAIE